MGDDSETHIVWRLVWGLLGAGLTFIVLSVADVQLAMPVVIAITIGAGIAVALVGPVLLDLLNVF